MSYGEVIDNMPLVLTALFFIVPAYYYFFGKPLDCSKVKRDPDIRCQPNIKKHRQKRASMCATMDIYDFKRSGNIWIRD